MLISTLSELRLHLPSNAIDRIENIQGNLADSERSLLTDKLGLPLHNRLVEYYRSIDPEMFAQHVIDGTYTSNPWEELLFLAQSVIVKDAMCAYVRQNSISINGAGVNVMSSSDYAPADDKRLAESVQSFKANAYKSLNNLLKLLEEWAKAVNTPVAITDDTQASPSEPSLSDDTQASPSDASMADDTQVSPSDTSISDDTQASPSDASMADDTQAPPSEPPLNDDPAGEGTEAPAALFEPALPVIVSLWCMSRYYYLDATLLIPTCTVLQAFLDIEDYRDRFIRLLPDIRFIQRHYIEKTFGEAFVEEMRMADESDPLLFDVRSLIVAHLKVRTTVLDFDKATKAQAHNETVSLRDSILSAIAKRNAAPTEEQAQDTTTETPKDDKQRTFRNNSEGNKMFVSPMLV